MHFFLVIAYTALFCLLIYKLGFFRLKGFSKFTPLLLFLIKVLAGLGLWFIYTIHDNAGYGSDFIIYFKDAAVFFKAFKNDPAEFIQLFFGDEQTGTPLRKYIMETRRWSAGENSGIINDNRLFIRFNALIHFFSFGYFHVHTVFMCFTSFVGLTALYKASCKIFKEKKRLLLILSFLIPSVAIWSSGIMKESLLMLGVGFVFYYSVKILNKEKLKRSILLLVLFLIVILYTKSYVAYALTPAVLSLTFLSLINKSSKKRIVLYFLVVHAGILIGGLNIHHFTSVQNPLVTLSQKQEAFFEAVETAKPRSEIEIRKLNDNIGTFLVNSPFAIVNTLLRPFPNNIKTVLYLFAFLENLTFILLAVLAVFHFKKPDAKQTVVLLFCISFVIILALLIGWVTPVIGAIVRYKVPLLPFYALIFAGLTDRKKVIANIPFTRYLI